MKYLLTPRVNIKSTEQRKASLPALTGACGPQFLQANRPFTFRYGPEHDFGIKFLFIASASISREEIHATGLLFRNEA
jgi:hypothetical protein